MLAVAIGVVLGMLLATIGLLLVPAAFMFANAGPGVLWGLLGSAFGCLAGGLGSLAGSWNTYRQLRGQTDWMKMPRWIGFDYVLAAYGLLGLACLAAGILANSGAFGALESELASSIPWAALLLGGLMVFQAALFLLYRAPFLFAGSRKPARNSGPAHASQSADSIGRISLWTSIAGLVLPVLLGLAGSALPKALRPEDSYIVFCAVLGLVLEVAAVGCGIVGRRSGAGKAGLIISVLSLVLFVLLFLASLVPSGHSGHETIVEPGEVVPAKVGKPSVDAPAPTRPEGEKKPE